MYRAIGSLALLGFALTTPVIGCSLLLAASDYSKSAGSQAGSDSGPRDSGTKPRDAAPTSDAASEGPATSDDAASMDARADAKLIVDGVRCGGTNVCKAPTFCCPKAPSSPIEGIDWPNTACEPRLEAGGCMYGPLSFVCDDSSDCRTGFCCGVAQGQMFTSTCRPSCLKFNGEFELCGSLGSPGVCTTGTCSGAAPAGSPPWLMTCR